MRENRTYGSEGGEGQTLPDPYPLSFGRVLPRGACGGSELRSHPARRENRSRESRHATQCPPRDRRPVAGRLPGCRRPSGREDAQCRSAGGGGDLFRPPFCASRAMRAVAGEPLYRPLPDEPSRRAERHAARCPARQHRPRHAAARLRPTLFGYTDQAVDPRTVAADSPWLRTYEGILPGFDVGLRLPEDPKPWLAWLQISAASPRRTTSGTCTCPRRGPPTGRATRRRPMAPTRRKRPS